MAKMLGAEGYVVKAQIHAGGRGKGGGVKIVMSADEAAAAAGDMLGMHLVTHQTGPEGKRVRKVWIEPATKIAKELYMAVVLDRGAECMAVMASPDGGMDIEEVAAKTPERIFTTRIDPGQPLWGNQGPQAAVRLRPGTQTGSPGRDAVEKPGSPGHGKGNHAHRGSTRWLSPLTAI